MRLLLSALVAIVLTLVATPAFAYIGPGAGITMLSALWGIIVAVVLALAAVLFWPIRALLRRRRKSEAPTTGDARSWPRPIRKLEAVPPAAGEPR